MWAHTGLVFLGDKPEGVVLKSSWLFLVDQGNLPDLWSSTGNAAWLESRSCRRRGKPGSKAPNASEIRGTSCLIFLWQRKGKTKTEQIFKALKCYFFHLRNKMFWLFQVYFFRPPRLLFCRKHEISSFFSSILDWKMPKQLDFPRMGVLNLTWYKLLLLFLISSLRDEMARSPSKELGRWRHSSRQGWAWLEQTLAQHPCPVGWSLASENPWYLSPGLGKSCSIHITPLSYRSLVLFLNCWLYPLVVKA